MKRTLIGLAVAVLILIVVIWLLPTSDAPPPVSSTSSADAEIEAVPDQSDAPSDEAGSAALAPGEVASEIEEFDPDAPPLLSGYVTGDGQPIAGAQLFFFATSEVEALIMRFDNMAGEFEGQIPHIPSLIGKVQAELEGFRRSGVSSKTDKDGYYELRGVKPGGYLALVVADQWLFRYGDVVSLERERESKLDVVLERGASIAGRVVQPDGTGMAGVRVIAEYRPANMPSVGKFVRRLLKYVNGEFLKGPFEVVSDENGAFQIDALPPGNYDITAYSSHGLSSTTEDVETGTSSVIVYFGRGSTLEGVVVSEDGAPVPNLQVKLESQSSLVDLPLPAVPFTEAINVMNQYLGEGPRSARTEEDGGFRFLHLGAGEYRLMIEQPGYVARKQTVQVDWGEVVSLEPVTVSTGQTLRGVVRGANGTPVEGATIISRPRQSMFGMGAMIRDFMTGRTRATSGADGTFVLSGLGNGPFEVSVTARGFTAQNKSQVRPGGEYLEFFLEPGVTWQGIVVNQADATPIPGVRVAAGPARATTDDEGRFALSGISAGGRGPFGEGGRRRGPPGRPGRNNAEPEGPRTTSLEASRKGYLTNYVEIEVENPPEEIVIELATAPSLEGLVLDPAGKPAPGALVRLVPDIPGEFEDILGFDSSLIFFAVTVSDTEGRFSFEEFFAPGDEEVLVIADHVTYARGRSEPFELEDFVAKKQEITVSLLAGGTIEGSVTDGTGPVAGAIVRLTRQRETSWRERMMLQMMGFDKGGQVQRTNAEGKFVYEKVKPGDYELRAEKVGFTETQEEAFTLTEGSTERVDFVLDAGETLTGTVVDDAGTRLVGAAVRILQTDNRRMLETARVLGGAYQRTTTDESGAFVLTGLPRATYVVIAEMNGFSRSESSPLDPTSKVPVNLILVPTASLRGLVQDEATGEPITNFQVMVHDQAEGEPAWAMDAREVNDPEGAFLRDDLRAGEIEIEIRAAGFVTTKTPITLAPGGLTEETFTLSTAGNIVGIVYSPQGEPLEGAAVALAKPDATGNSDDEEAIQDFFTEAMLGERVYTDETGRFTLDNVPDGPQTVVVTHESYVQFQEDNAVVPQGEQLELSITLSQGLSIRGTVVDPLQTPVPEHFLFLRSDVSGISKTARSDEYGRFEFTGLTPGSYRILSAGSDEELSAPVLVELTESKDNVVVPLLPPTPVIPEPEDG